jgi:Flp pilus assembly pilin Flp
MRKVLRGFTGDESGATAVEYGALVGVKSIGLSVQGTFLEIRAAFAGSASAQN